MLVAIRDGRNELQKDLSALDKVISQKTLGFNIYDYATYYVDALNDSNTETLIRSLKPHIIVQAGAGILKENIFIIARKGTLNVHHGLAPEVRGIKSTFWCLYYGLTDLIGVTCHLIDQNLDTGNIISQYKYDYQHGDTFLKIQEDLCEKGAQLLVKAIDVLGNYSSLEFQESEINSFYFGSVNYINYNELKKREFRAVKSNDVSSLRTKLKVKRILIPKDF
jgi:methionyl-tRNA formyltransferase